MFLTHTSNATRLLDVSQTHKASSSFYLSLETLPQISTWLTPFTSVRLCSTLPFQWGISWSSYLIRQLMLQHLFCISNSTHPVHAFICLWYCLSPVSTARKLARQSEESILLHRAVAHLLKKCNFKISIILKNWISIIFKSERNLWMAVNIRPL